MTRKDYIVIAAALNFTKRVEDAQPECFSSIAAVAALNVSATCATDNPRFDVERFAQACGWDSAKTMRDEAISAATWSNETAAEAYAQAEKIKTLIP